MDFLRILKNLIKFAAIFFILYFLLMANQNTLYNQNLNTPISYSTRDVYTKTSTTETSTISRDKKDKLLILYAYFEKDVRYIQTLQFFIELGVVESDSIDYLFIIQGYNTTVKIPEFKNVKILRRSNDCFDFGAYGAGFAFLGGLDSLKRYSYFMFINPSAMGPILPKYWPESIHWSEIFTSRLKGNVHACGTSLFCEYLGPGKLT
jgi:hypothetical protein